MKTRSKQICWKLLKPKNKLFFLRAFVPLWLFVFLIAGCAEKPSRDNLLRSMGEFDQLYVPALVFSNLHKQRETELAIERVSRSWVKIYRRYIDFVPRYGVDIVDHGWKHSFNQVTLLIVSAEAAVKARDLPGAHGQLEQVRHVLQDLRRRNGYDYFLDNLTDFDKSLNSISAYLRGKGKLGEMDRNRLREHFNAAQQSLLAADTAAVKPAIRVRIGDELKLLALFAASLSGREAAPIIQAAKDLRPNFDVLYKAFGDFQPVFDQMVKEREAEYNSKHENKSKVDPVAKKASPTSKSKGGSVRPLRRR